jgi:hypothetical protein
MIGTRSNVSVHLTERDLKIMGDLYRFRFLTFGQLKEKYFERRSKGTLSNRLSRLKFAGFVSRMPVGVLPGGGIDRSIGTLFRLTPKGITALRTAMPSEIYFSLSPVTVAALHHDTVLNSLLVWSERENPGAEIITEGGLRRKLGGTRSQVPDALIVDTTSGTRIAVELELTQKSESRYREIVLNYQLSKDYDHVLYVLGNAAIESKLKKVITGGGSISGAGPESFHPFAFAPLEKVLREKRFSPMALLGVGRSNVIPLASRIKKTENSGVIV